MIGEIKDEYGVTIRNAQRQAGVQARTPATARQSRAGRFQYETGFTLLPGRYVIKCSRATRRLAASARSSDPFSIPNLDSEKARLPTSTVVLSTQRVVPREALYTVQQKFRRRRPTRSSADGLKLIPSVTRTFSANAPLLIFLQAYERDLPAPAAGGTPHAMRPLVAFAAFYRDGVKTFETDAVGIETGIRSLGRCPSA